MRSIALFNKCYDFSHILNIFSYVARRGESVLLVDFRGGWRGEDFESLVYEVERGLYRVSMGGKLGEMGFSFFGMEGLRGLGEGYDYVVFEIGFDLKILEMNALNVSSEVMVLHTLGGSEFYEVSRFLKGFNNVYSKGLLISNVIPVYSGVLDDSLFCDLVTSYSSYFITYPLPVEKGREYGNALRGILESLEYSEDFFDSNYGDFIGYYFREKKYEGFLDRASKKSL